MKTRPTDSPIVREFIVEKAGPKTPGNGRVKITTEKPDRMGDIVVASGGDFKAYLKNPVVLYGHNSRGFPVAKTVELLAVDGKHVEAEFEFAPTFEGDTCKVLWEGGFLSAASIGFIPDYSKAEELPMPDGAWWPPLKFHKWELTEWSIVPVPANAGALRLAISEYDAGRKDHLDAILKSGAVLNAANKNNLKEARDLIERVLASAEPADEGNKGLWTDGTGRRTLSIGDPGYGVALENASQITITDLTITDTQPDPIETPIAPDNAASIALAISVAESVDLIVTDAIRADLADVLCIDSIQESITSWN